MSEINKRALRETLARVKSLGERAVSIRSQAATQKFPVLDANIAATAGLLAACAMEALSGFKERLAALETAPVLEVVADILPVHRNMSPEVIVAAFLAGHSILLDNIVDQLNKADLMLEGKMSTTGLTINRGALWDK